jgi:hypothetical protein
MVTTTQTSNAPLAHRCHGAHDSGVRQPARPDRRLHLCLDAEHNLIQGTVGGGTHQHARLGALALPNARGRCSRQQAKAVGACLGACGKGVRGYVCVGGHGCWQMQATLLASQ